MPTRAAAALSAICLVLPAAAAPAFAGTPQGEQADEAVTASQPVYRHAPEPAAAAPPAARGRVARLLIDPHGDVDGLWLDNGIIVRFSPRIGGQVAGAVHAGDRVSVAGVPYAAGTVHATEVRNENDGRAVAEPAGGGQPPAAEQDEPMESLEPLQAEGTIEVVLRGRRSEANGVILEDGSIVRFPPYTMPFVVRPGQRFAAAGRGTRNDYGLAIQAASVGRSLEVLQPLYAGAR